MAHLRRIGIEIAKGKGLFKGRKKGTTKGEPEPGKGTEGERAEGVGDRPGDGDEQADSAEVLGCVGSGRLGTPGRPSPGDRRSRSSCTQRMFKSWKHGINFRKPGDRFHLPGLLVAQTTRLSFNGASDEDPPQASRLPTSSLHMGGRTWEGTIATLGRSRSGGSTATTTIAVSRFDIRRRVPHTPHPDSWQEKH